MYSVSPKGNEDHSLGEVAQKDPTPEEIRAIAEITVFVMRQELEKGVLRHPEVQKPSLDTRRIKVSTQARMQACQEWVDSL